MKEHLKRLTAWILVLAMTLGSNTMTVFAEEVEDVINDISAQSDSVEPTSQEVEEIFISGDDVTAEDLIVETIDETEEATENVVTEITAQEYILSDDGEDTTGTDNAGEVVTPDAFESGYVRIAAGTTVYSSTNKEDELGTVDADAVVYVSEVITDQNGNIEWIRVSFETTEEKTVNGYAVGASATILEGENEVSIVSFTFKEAETLEKKNVSIPANTTVYEQPGGEAVLGTIEEAGTVYVLEVAKDEASVWLRVSFAAESGKTIEGYVVYSDEMIVSAEGGSTVVKFCNTAENAEDEGYVRLSAGTLVYTDAALEEKLGTIDAEATVYARLAKSGDSEAKKVYMIFFAAEDGSSYEGYIDGTAIAFLSADEEPETDGNMPYIPVIAFTAKVKGITEGQWVYDVVDGYARVLGYLDYEVTSLTIPDQLGGYYVNAIGQKAFVKNTKLTSMYVHGNVINIADDAFASKNVTLSGYNGSEVLRYAQNKGMPGENRTNVTGLEFRDHVIDYSYADGSRYEYAGEGAIRMAAAEAAQLSVGSLFYVPEKYGELVTAYKVESISMEGAWCVISVSDAPPEELLERMCVSDEMLYADWSAAEWADDVELVEEKLDVHLSGMEGSVSFNAKKDLGKGFELAFSVSGSLGAKADLDVRFFPTPALEELSVVLNPKFTISGSLGVEGDFGDEEKQLEKRKRLRELTHTVEENDVLTDIDYELYLGKVPLISAAGLASVTAGMYLQVKVSGEISVTFKAEGKLGIKWDKGQQKFVGVHDFGVTWPPEVSAEGMLEIGPKESLSVEFALVGKTLSAELFNGFTGKASWEPTSHLECIDISAGWKIECSAKVTLEVLEKLSKKYNWDFTVGRSFKLFELTGNIGHLHIEIGRGIMLRCSYDEKCNVSFHTGTSTKLDSKLITYYTLLDEPEIEINGQRPEGWYTDKAFQNPWDFTKDKVTQDMTLYAKWNLVKHEVIYHQGVVDPEHNLIESTVIRENATEGLTISKIADPMHPDYIFRGWYKDKDYSTQWDFNNDLMPANDLELWAKWEYQEGYDPYQVSTGGSGSGGTDVTHGLGYDVEYNGHKYKHIMTYLTYDAAEQYARDHGGYLMTITSKQEQDILARYVNYDCAQEFLWLGIRSNGNWTKWNTQEDVVYSNWASGFPTTSASAYNGVMRRATGTWETLSNTSTAHFVIEWGGFSVGTGATQITNGVTYTTTKTYAKATGYIGNDSTLVIDEYYNGLPVTEIESSAFKGNTNLTNIVLPSQLKTIGNDAFNGCTKLTGITIPDSVEEIGDSCFKNCSALQSVIWSSKVDTIGNNMFYNAKNLTRITNIDSVKSIENSAFYYCGKLVDFVFPGTLTSIGQNAFYYCRSLPDIIMPDTVTSMDSGAFRYCSGAKVIMVSGGLKTLEGYVFNGCSGATDIYIPSTILSISVYSPLYSVNGTYHVYKGSTAHKWAEDNSKTIDLLGSTYRVNFVTYTDGNASSGVKDGTQTDNMYVAVGSRITEPAVEIDGKVIEGWYLDPEFKQKWDFANDKMPEGNITLYARWVESADVFEFDVVSGTARITAYKGSNYNVVIPDTIKGYKVTALAENSISGSSIGILTIPASVKSIAGGAITCPNLITVNVSGNYYKTDSEGVLYSASGNNLIFAPKGRKLTTYEVPEGTVKIYAKAFAGQDILQKVTIPGTVTSIAPDAFEGLHMVVLYGPMGSCAAKTFANKYFFAYNEYKVYYYNGTEMLYDATITAGERIKDYFQPISEFEEFAGWYKDEALTEPWDFESDTMPAGNINLYLKWKSLFSVSLSDGAVTITGYSGNDNDIVIPSEISGYPVTGIAVNAFKMDSYQSVTIPDSVVTIENGAFADHITLIGSENSKAYEYCVQNGNTFAMRKYTISFEVYGGSAIKDIAVAPGTTQTLPTPIRDNYIFGGWYTDTGYETKWDDSTVMPEHDVTLHAQWLITSNNILDGIAYTVLDDGTIEINSYSGDKTVLTIPDTVNGYTVSRIGSYAFYENTTILVLTLPTTVTSIGEYAFANSAVRTVKGMTNVSVVGEAAFLDCAGLSTIDSATGLTAIGNSAFKGTGLTEFLAPESLLAIGKNAFYDCEHLDTVTLNAGLTSLGRGAFESCPKLLQATIPSMVEKDAELAFDGACQLTYTESDNIAILDWSVGTGTYVTVRWNGVAGATQYVLARKTETVTKMTRWSTYYSSETRNATVNAGKLGQTAEIVVIACDENKKAICTSEPISVYLSTLGTPSILSVEQTGSQTTRMTIQKVTGASGYEIERTNEPDGVFTFLKSVTVSSFQNSGLMPGRNYYYRIRAYKIVDGVKTYSRYSDVYYFHMPYKFVSAPENVTARQSAATEIKVTWNPVRDAEGYLVYRSIQGGEFTQFAETLGPSYTNTGIVVGCDYAYKICAYFTQQGERIIGSESEAVPITVQPIATPSITNVTQFRTSVVKVTWSAVSDAVGYMLYRSDSVNGTYKRVKTVTTTQTNDLSSVIFGNTYYYKVCAYKLDEEGNQIIGNLSPAVSLTINTVPTIEGLSVVQTTAAGAKASWSGLSGLSGYELWISANNMNNFALNTTVTGKTADVTGLQDGVTYYLKVRAFVTKDSETEYGAFSDVKEVTILGSPEIQVLEQEGTKTVRIIWTKTESADGYEVWRQGGTTTTFKLWRTLTGNQALNTSLAYDTLYSYKVRSYKTVDGVKKYSPYSEIKKIRLLDAPSLAKVVRSDTRSATLTWTEVTGATGYDIYRSNEADGIFKLWKTVTDLTATNTSLTVGASYFYKVVPYSMVNGEKQMGKPSAVRGIYMLPTPKITGIESASSTSVRVFWSEVEGATGYKLLRDTTEDGAFSAVKKVTTLDTTSISLTANTRYYFKVVAYAEIDGVTYESLPSAVTDTYFINLAKPTIQSLEQPSPVSLTLKWSGISGADGYELVRSETEDGPYKSIKSVTELSATNTSLKVGGQYYYKVRGYKQISTSENAYGVFSDPVAVTLLAAPKITAVYRITNTNAKITWSAVDNATSYQLYRATEVGGPYKLVRTTSDTTYTNGGLTVGTQYYYKVSAVNESNGITNIGPKSASGNVVINDLSYTKITSFVQNGDGTVTLRWNSVDGAEGYEVSKSEDGNTFSKVKNTSSTGTMVSGLTNGNTYSFRVRMYKTVDGSRQYGGYSTSVSVTLMNAPVITSTTHTSPTEVVVRWNAVNGATSYKVYQKPEGGSYKLAGTVTDTTITCGGLKKGICYYYKIVAVKSTTSQTNKSGYSEEYTAYVLESAHNYANNTNQTWSFTLDNASSLEIKFSSATLFENSYDKLYITDANGDSVENSPYTGSELAGVTITVPGDTVNLQLKTDGSVTRYGFAVEYIKAVG